MFLIDGDQGRQLKTLPQSYIDYFKLKFLEKQQVQKGHFDTPLSPSMWEINLPCEAYPPCTRRLVRDILNTRDRNSGPKSLYKQTFTSNLLSKPKLCLNSLLIKHPNLSFFVLSNPHKYIVFLCKKQTNIKTTCFLLFSEHHFHNLPFIQN